MARGHIDYGAGGATEYVSSLKDMAELAVRNGSINVFDRSGNVVFMDGFEYGLMPYQIYNGGTGNTVIDNTISFMGGRSAHITTGGSVGGSGNLSHYFPIQEKTSIGVEFSFRSGANIDYIGIYIQGVTFGELRRASLYINTCNGEIFLNNTASGKIVVDTIATGHFTNNYWHTVKLVVDLSTNMYVRALFDGYNYDISNHEIFHMASAVYSTVLVKFTALAATYSNKETWLDNIIITINEPI